MPPKHRYSSSSDSEGSDVVPKKRQHRKKGEEYRVKRDRNNVAVRKSREKSRQKAKETIEKVNRLKQENEDLEMKVKLLSKELNLLKDLFLGHATGGATNTVCVPPLEVKTEESHDGSLNSCGETDNSVDSVDSSFVQSAYGSFGAGTLVNAEAVQKDHEYSVPAALQ